MTGRKGADRAGPGDAGPGDRGEERRDRRRAGFRRRLGHSLFLQLTLILVAAGVLVNICVGAFFRMAFSHRFHEALGRNLDQYTGFLAREIGSPPDTAKARELARANSLQILYRGPGGDWTTEPGLEVPPERPRRWHGGGGNIGWNRGRYYARTEWGGASYLFVTDFRHAVGARWPFVAGLIGLLSAILGGTYLLIRRLFSPVRDLTAAVERLGNGELGSQVPDRCRKDELGDLARAFNTMSTRLRDMVRSREQLLLDVSHELRSPLTRLKVALEMAPEGVAKESIRDDLGEMESMIGEILEAARLDSAAGRLSPETADLGELAGEAVRAFGGSPPGVRLAAPGGGPVRAAVDRERVRKVLSNVIGNAVKYSREGSAPVEVALERRAGEAVISVRDRGIGIPAGDLPRLFEPFYRVDRSRSRDTGGYGLGLSLCKRIMEAHGGRIEIGSRVGEGTEVRLFFPLPSG